MSIEKPISRNGKNLVTVRAAVACLFLVGIPWAIEAQSFVIGFPIANANPYTAPVITVLDHSSPYFYDKQHQEVQAYTGEMGEVACGPSRQPCGYYNPNFTPDDPGDTSQFIVNGNYVGTNADCAPAGETPPCLEQVKVLNYRGHSGYDFAYASGTAVVAPADGDLYVPALDPINSPSSDPWCTFHTIFIDHGHGWTTWYLHTDRLAAGAAHPCTNGTGTTISADEFIGHVIKGQAIAYVGGFANGSATGISPHLHFEVRRGCEYPSGAVQNCLIVDPYGWEWMGTDPISNVIQNPNTVYAGQPAAAVQIAPLWDLPEWNTQLPVVTGISLTPSSDGYTATITGKNFAPQPEITMWSRSGYYWAATFIPIPNETSSSQITIDLPTATIPDPTQYVLKVRNPGGPRSAASALSLSGDSKSVPLLLSGISAPGGGTFAGFIGFESVSDRGQALFSSGVDLNGDGAPDQFADFSWLAGKITRMSVPGFANVSSVASHVKVDQEGDLAFGDISGLYGTAPAAIYSLLSGTSSPIEITGYGQPCPAPCPTQSSETVYAPTGPLAISSAGDVVFAASLANLETRVATCCYLYLWTANSQSITLIAADGPSGTPTPIGGTFAAGTFVSPLTGC